MGVTKKDIGKLLAAVQDSHQETRFVGSYMHFSCAGCGQPVGRSGHIYPPYLTMRCYQSGCQFSHKWQSAYEYLAYATGDSAHGVRDKLKRTSRTIVYTGDLGTASKRAARVTLPDGIPITIGGGIYARKAREYLTGRGFDLEYLWREFALTYTQFDNGGKAWDRRLIVPFKNYAGELVYYQGRDYMGVSTLRWKNPKSEEVPVGKSEVIYNEPALYAGGRVYVCEGAGDVWELFTAVGVSGKEPSPKQLSKMTRSNAESYYLAFDPGAWLDTLQTGFVLLATGKPIYLIQMEDGDANEIGREAVERLADNAVHLTYDNYEDEYSRVEYGDKGHTFRGKTKSTIRLW